MSIAYIVVTILAALMVGFSAFAVFFHVNWVVQALIDYGVPRSWLPWLGTAKAAGAMGLLVGLFVPYEPAVAVALIWLAHCGIDRALGYGLKYQAGFGFTHLGRIGRAA